MFQIYKSKKPCHEIILSDLISDINLIYDRAVIQQPGDVVDHYWKDIHDFECLSEHACTKATVYTHAIFIAYACTVAKVHNSLRTCMY